MRSRVAALVRSCLGTARETILDYLFRDMLMISTLVNKPRAVVRISTGTKQNNCLVCLTAGQVLLQMLRASSDTNNENAGG